jgi:O-methyltransferase
MCVAPKAADVRARLRHAAQALKAPATAAAKPEVERAAIDTAEPHELEIVERATPFTMTSHARKLANIDAIDYIIRRDLPGAIVECGVWRGGSVLVMLERLRQLGRADRDVYLFDTFEGMTAPTTEDVSPFQPPAIEDWEATPQGERAWDHILGDRDLYSPEGVRRLLTSTGYPADRLHFVVGPVEETVPAQAPETIAVLRLDTDWYESTAHELEHLYPRLCPGGVLIIDDYGHWAGARKAAEEFFGTRADPILLSRLDYSARMGIKG